MKTALTFIYAFLLIGCANSDITNSLEVSSFINTLVGEETINIIANPDKVELISMNLRNDNGEHVINSNGELTKKLTDQQVNSLQWLLLDITKYKLYDRLIYDPSALDLQLTTFCGFSTAFTYIFTMGNELAEVSLSKNCESVEFRNENRRDILYLKQDSAILHDSFYKSLILDQK